MLIVTHSEFETEKIGEDLALKIKSGDCLALQGPLGSGKTALTRGLCRGLKCTVEASSPTFNIVNIYPGAIEVAHVDLYRIGGDLASIGWDDLLDNERIVVVEWAEKAGGYLPERCISIHFKIVDQETRELEVEYSHDSRD